MNWSLLGPGVRAGVPLGLAALLIGLSFGVLARPVMGPIAPIVMSMVLFAGSAQFGSLAVLAAGGGALPAIVAGLLLNARFLPMGIAVAPSLPGSATRRAVEGQAVVDASWALANQGDGRFDRHMLLGATLPQYPAWVGGTVLGVLLGDAHRRSGQVRARRALPGLLPRAARAGAAHPDGGGRGARAPRR